MGFIFFHKFNSFWFSLFKWRLLFLSAYFAFRTQPRWLFCNFRRGYRCYDDFLWAWTWTWTRVIFIISFVTYFMTRESLKSLYWWFFVRFQVFQNLIQSLNFIADIANILLQFLLARTLFFLITRYSLFYFAVILLRLSLSMQIRANLVFQRFPLRKRRLSLQLIWS